jgi:hypothetical protein
MEELRDRRAALLAELADVEAQLHDEMRAMRAAGATLQQILAASGYRSVDGVRKILDPAVREAAAVRRSTVRRVGAGRS